MKLKLICIAVFLVSVDIFAQGRSDAPANPPVITTGEEYVRRANARNFRGCDRNPSGNVLGGTGNLESRPAARGGASPALRRGQR